MSSTGQASQNESKAVVFVRRLISSILLLGVVFYGLLTGGTISVVLVGGIILLLNIAGLLEFYSMVNANGLPRFKWIGLAGGVTLVSVLFLLGRVNLESLIVAGAPMKFGQVAVASMLYGGASVQSA